VRAFIRVAPTPGSFTPELMAARYGVSMEVAERMSEQARSEEMWVNDEFQVSKSGVFVPHLGGWPPMVHLSIIPLDGRTGHPWAEMQQIKNMLMGPEFEAIEIYPAESRLVDMGVNYHLWVFIEPYFRVPIGWNYRMVKGEQ